VWIRNWEHNAASGLPISGATVEVRNASLVSPNTGTIIASTTTDPNGMWEFTSLPDAAVDVKVISGGNIWWHKGMTKHSVDAIFYVTPIPRTDNFLRNGGFEAATALGAGPWTVTADVPVLDGWRAVAGAGSTGTVSRDTTIHAPDSTTSAKVIYSKVSGNFALYQQIALPSAFRGKQVSVSAQVRQGVANSTFLRIADSGGSAVSSTSATTGSFVTLTATRTVDANATLLQIEVQLQVTDTIYVDNVIVNLGATPSTYQPEYWYPGAVTTDMLADLGVTTPKLADLGVTTAKIASGAVDNSRLAAGAALANIGAGGLTNTYLAAGAALANLGYTPVNKVGDTMTGNLTVQAGGVPTQGFVLFGNSGARFVGFNGAQFLFSGANLDVPSLTTAGGMSATGGLISGSNIQVMANGSPTQGYAVFGNAGTIFIGGDGSTVVTNTGKVWTQGNDGAGSGLDADTVDGLQPGNANGNIPISNGTVNTNLNADLLDGLDSTAFTKVSAAGTQTITSMSGGVTLTIGTIPAGPLSGLLGTYVNGNLGASGTKNRFATGHDGTVGVFHSIETPLPMFEEHGRSKLVAGAAWVAIPRDLANYVDLTDYYVQVTAEGPTALYVTDRTPEGFVVRSLLGDTATEFTWHLVARQGDMTHIERLLPLAEVPA
jgi:hypothetical protein